MLTELPYFKYLLLTLVFHMVAFQGPSWPQLCCYVVQHFRISFNYIINFENNTFLYYLWASQYIYVRIKLWDDLWIMDWEGYRKKQSWLNLKHYPGICLEILNKPRKNLWQDTQCPTRWRRHFLSTSHKCYCFSQPNVQNLLYIFSFHFLINPITGADNQTD